MHVDIDQYSLIESVFQKWDPRFKIITLIFMMCIVALLKELSTVMLALVFIVIISMFSKLPAKYLTKRTVFPIFFLIPLIIFLVFTSGGEVITQAILPVYKKGIIISITILGKTVSILLLFTLMMSTTQFRIMGISLRMLKVPEKLVFMILFTYRYLYVYVEDIRKMKTALRLRAYKPRNSLHSLKSTANVIGTLLIKSFEQTERIYHAMILRGYDGTHLPIDTFNYTAKDILKSIAGSMISIVILIIDNCHYLHLYQY